MNTITLPAMIQLAAVTVALGLFAVGLYASVSDLKYSSADPADGQAHSLACFKKGIIFVAGGIAVLALARIINLCLASGGQDIFRHIGTGLWETLRDRAFLLLLPLGVWLWRRHSAAK